MSEEKNWGIRDFMAGMIDSDAIDDNLIPENAARSCQNFIARTMGKMKKRPGQARLNAADLGGFIQGLHAYYYGATPTRRLVAAYNGKAAYWNPGTTLFVEIRTGMNTSAPVLFEDCVNYLVACNGIDVPWKWDGTAVSALLNAPATAQFPTLHKEQLFVVPKSEPSTLYWSDFFQPEVWPSTNYQQIKEGDGDTIKALVKYLGELFIFKGRSIHSLRGTDVNDFRLDETDSKHGCVGPRAVVQSGIHLYYVSDDGIYLFNGMTSVNLTRQYVPKLWAGVNKEHLHKAACGVWNGLIWFALPEAASTVNNLLLIYRPPAGETPGAFWPWRGINASCFLDYNDGQQVLFYAGDSGAGYVNRQDVAGDDFTTTPITAYWEGKAYDMGMAEIEKKARKAFVQMSPDTAVAPTLAVSLNYGAFNVVSYVRVHSLVQQYRFVAQSRWRYLAPKFTHSAAGQCEIRGLLIPHKAKARPKVRGA